MIARAIILEPEVLVADEPVSMLDMSVRAKILQLMLDLKQELGLTYVYITHDLATAKYFCDRIAIMYLGRIVEIGPTEEIFANPRHPYTKALLKAIPEPDPDRRCRATCPAGRSPTPPSRRSAARFHPRCPEAVAGLRMGVARPARRSSRSTGPARWRRTTSEQAVIGDLDGLDQPSTTAKLGKGGAGEVRALLDRIRAKDPDEPMWKGVRGIQDAGNAVEVQFEPADAPSCVAPAPSTWPVCSTPTSSPGVNPSAPDLLVLHALRIAGMADELKVARRYALDPDQQYGV